MIEKTIIKTNNIDNHIYTTEYPFIIDTEKGNDFCYDIIIESIEENTKTQVFSSVKRVYEDIHIEDGNTTRTKTIEVVIDNCYESSIINVQRMADMVNSKKTKL